MSFLKKRETIWQFERNLGTMNSRRNWLCMSLCQCNRLAKVFMRSSISPGLSLMCSSVLWGTCTENPRCTLLESCQTLQESFNISYSARKLFERTCSGWLPIPKTNNSANETPSTCTCGSRKTRIQIPLQNALHGHQSGLNSRT